MFSNFCSNKAQMDKIGLIESELTRVTGYLQARNAFQGKKMLLSPGNDVENASL
jgi:hypothetical protein